MIEILKKEDKKYLVTTCTECQTVVRFKKEETTHMFCGLSYVVCPVCEAKIMIPFVFKDENKEEDKDKSDD